MADADGDAEVVQRLPDVVGCTPSTTKETALPRISVVSGPRTEAPVDRAQAVEKACGQGDLVLADLVQPDLRQVVAGRCEPDRLADDRRAGLEALGRRRVGRRAISTTSIIEPPPMNGGMALSSSVRPHSTPTPDGPSILWPVKA